MIFKEYNKAIQNHSKLIGQIKESIVAPEFSHIRATVDNGVHKLFIYLTGSIAANKETVLDDLVNNFIDFTTAESLKIYLDTTIFPFVENLIHSFAAENMAMGITQAGKTPHVLGLFEKQYDIYQNGLPISLKGSFDTGSLYESVAILTFLANNPNEYAGLAPFVTPERLQDMAGMIVSELSG